MLMLWALKEHRDESERWIDLELDDEDVFEHPPSPGFRRNGDKKGSTARCRYSWSQRYLLKRSMYTKDIQSRYDYWRVNDHMGSC